MADWQVHRPGRDPELDAVIARRFGSKHDKPCVFPTMVTCAQWGCQVLGRCRYERPTPPNSTGEKP